MARPQAELGVFGGSGFYAFLDGVEEHKIETPYGAPSDKVAIGEVEGRRVAFLPRHGRRHQYPPHKIPYRANLWAMKELGVTRVIGPCAAGSLQAEAAPGHFVICDQVVDRTWGRDDTFYDGPETTHISFADPYCPELRALALKEAQAQGITAHDGGTMVNPTLRNYRIPAFADVPRSDVFFADTYDAISPLGAKAQGEGSINPVAPAIANALADATGVRFAHLPFTPDRIFDKLSMTQ